MNPDRLTAADAAVLTSTAVLLRAIRNQTGLAYGDDTWSPVSNVTLNIMASRLGAELREARLSSGVQEIGVPAYLGYPIVVVNRGIPAAYRALALRHGLAHLMAGELEAEQGAEIRFMSTSLDPFTISERRADLFALVDLIPDRDLHDDPEWLAGEISSYAPDWSGERLFDRVDLRLALWRTR